MRATGGHVGLLHCFVMQNARRRITCAVLAMLPEVALVVEGYVTRTMLMHVALISSVPADPFPGQQTKGNLWTL